MKKILILLLMLISTVSMTAWAPGTYTKVTTTSSDICTDLNIYSESYRKNEISDEHFFSARCLISNYINDEFLEDGIIIYFNKPISYRKAAELILKNKNIRFKEGVKIIVNEYRSNTVAANINKIIN